MNGVHPLATLESKPLPHVNPDTGKPSVLCAWLAAAMPPLFIFFGLIIIILSLAAFGNGHLRLNLAEVWYCISGLMKVTLFAGTLIGIGGCTALLALGGLGKRIPAVLLLLLASLPWICGTLYSLLAKQYIMGILMEELPTADIGVVASSLGNTLSLRLAGSLFSGLLLSACAIGLAIAAIGQRATGKRAAAILLLLVSGIPLFVFTPWWVFRTGLGVSGLLSIMMAGGGIVVVILAGVGTPASSPNTRNWPLAAASTGASWMAFMAAAAFCSSLSIMKIFTDIATEESPEGPAILHELTSVTKSAETLFLVGGVLAILPMLVLAIMSIVKAKYRGGWLAGAAAFLVLALGGILLLDQAAAKSISSVIQYFVSPVSSKASVETSVGKSGSNDLNFLFGPPPPPPPPKTASVMGKPDEGIVSIVGIPGGVIGAAERGVVGGMPLPPPSARGNNSPYSREPIKVGSNILESKLIKKVNPTYPELARRARVQGSIVLEIAIDRSGNVSNVRVVKGHPLLNQAAIDAVSQWRYSLTLLNGEPVPIHGTVAIDFALTANAPDK